MIRSSLLIITFFLSLGIASAQTENDVIYFIEGPVEALVKEVGTDLIKYSYPNENAIYSVSKHQVTKIKFSSGREETFHSPIKSVNGLKDSENVYITYNPNDVQGLIPMGDLYSKATGVTILSSINSVKNRAMDKLKAEAAMVGANVVLIGNLYQRGNTYGGENQAGNSTQTSFSGTAFSSEKLDMEQAIEFLETYEVHHYQTHTLNRNAWSPEKEVATKLDKDHKPILFTIDQIREEDNKLFVSTPDIRSKTKELQVIYVADDHMILMERNNQKVINYLLINENNDHLQALNRRRYVGY